MNAELLRDGAHWWQGRVEMLIVEGVGGLLCPLSNSETVADLAEELQLPLLIVVRLGLGSINHALLTVEVAQPGSEDRRVGKEGRSRWPPAP